MKPSKEFEDQISIDLQALIDAPDDLSFKEKAQLVHLDFATDFVGSNCKNLDLSNQDLSNINFSEADCSGVNWENSDISGCIFVGAIVEIDGLMKAKNFNNIII